MIQAFVVLMQVDLGLCCAVFCAAPSSVGFSANTGKGPNVVVVVQALYQL
jgi:hypothetical protein